MVEIGEVNYLVSLFLHGERRTGEKGEREIYRPLEIPPKRKGILELSQTNLSIKIRANQLGIFFTRPTVSEVR
jgi:putative ubiquitin-RnfH superfamily antitoxin RatB of RatAB toxin-antitoxin module